MDNKHQPIKTCDGTQCGRSEEERRKDFSEGKIYCKIDGGELVFSALPPPSTPLWKKGWFWGILIGIILLLLAINKFTKTRVKIDDDFIPPVECQIDTVGIRSTLNLIADNNINKEIKDRTINPLINDFFADTATIHVVGAGGTAFLIANADSALYHISQEPFIDSIKIVRIETNEDCEIITLYINKIVSFE